MWPRRPGAADPVAAAAAAVADADVGFVGMQAGAGRSGVLMPVECCVAWLRALPELRLPLHQIGKEQYVLFGQQMSRLPSQARTAVWIVPWPE